MSIVRWILGKIILFVDALTSPAPPERSAAENARLAEKLRGLAIYQYAACPFCVKVRRYLKREGLEVPLRDAKQDPARAELLAGGGKLQVPCLRIEDGPDGVKWLYESGDIIAYLKERTEGA